MAGTTRITPEEFEAWREQPVTQLVMQALSATIDAVQADWLAKSWNSGLADQEMLSRMKTRVQTLRDLRDLSFDDAAAAAGLTPVSPETPPETEDE